MDEEKQITTFVEYVWDCYSPQSGLYTIKGLEKRHIKDAFFIYIYRMLKGYPEHYTWGDGDSVDRERVADIILEQPQFTIQWHKERE